MFHFQRTYYVCCLTDQKKKSLKMENLMYWEDENLRGKYHPPDCRTIKLKVILDSQSKLPLFPSQVTRHPSQPIQVTVFFLPKYFLTLLTFVPLADHHPIPVSLGGLHMKGERGRGGQRKYEQVGT